MNRRIALLALVLTGCDLFNPDPTKPPPNPPPVSTVPDVELKWLPALPDSSLKLLADLSGGRLAVDPDANDALTALAACTDHVVYCYQPGSVDLRTCLQATKSCTTDTPWTESEVCCPDACKTAYAAAVASGEAANRAFERVFYLEPDCFPGVRALLEAP
jgi:hypothetical protein